MIHMYIYLKHTLHIKYTTFTSFKIKVDLNSRNKLLTQKLLKQGYQNHNHRKTLSNFYRRYYDLISKFQVGIESLLRQGLSEPELYGDLMYELKKIVGSNNFQRSLL